MSTTSVELEREKSTAQRDKILQMLSAVGLRMVVIPKREEPFSRAQNRPFFAGLLSAESP